MPIIAKNDWTIDISQKQWADILLLLQEYGWKPVMQNMAYLANVEVSEQNACGIVETGLQIQEKALNAPFDFYPINVNMGILAEFIELCREGSFSIKAEG